VKKMIITAALLQGLCVTGPVFARTAPSAGNLTPVELRCEYARNPLGVDAAHPHLSWMLKSRKRKQSQTAFRIIVASSREILAENKGDLWDTQKVRSDETIRIYYRGRPLKSSQRVFWKVQVWDDNGSASSWSRAASWTMGLLDKADWQAKWIAANRTEKDPLPIFRKSFRLGKSVKDAIIHICGLGHYELL